MTGSFQRRVASRPMFTNSTSSAPSVATLVSLDLRMVIKLEIRLVTPTPLSKEASIVSRLRPLVSGMNSRLTIEVNNVEKPNKKYTPYEERARKIGVVNATIQLTICSCVHVSARYCDGVQGSTYPIRTVC